MKNGILNLYKEKGFTSHDAVNCVRRLFGTKKVGHTGTLDPQATGVLPILVGNAVKASQYLSEGEKCYRATLRFGLFTDTEDIWGTVKSRSDKRCTEKAFAAALQSFLGEYRQIPPMVSAVRVGGKKLYEYAREGLEIAREPRSLFIRSLTLLSFSGDSAEFSVCCSKGTYVRTLIFDLCRKLGVEGVMSALERQESGGFTKETAITIQQLENMTPAEREEQLVPTESLFADLKILSLPDFFLRLLKNGCTIDLKKAGVSEEFGEGERLRLYDTAGFFALGEIQTEENRKTVKKIKEFPQE